MCNILTILEDDGVDFDPQNKIAHDKLFFRWTSNY